MPGTQLLNVLVLCEWVVGSGDKEKAGLKRTIKIWNTDLIDLKEPLDIGAGF